MKASRVSRSNVMEKLRSANVTDFSQVRAVVLEATGNISVLHGPTLAQSLSMVSTASKFDRRTSGALRPLRKFERAACFRRYQPGSGIPATSPGAPRYRRIPKRGHRSSESRARIISWTTVRSQRCAGSLSTRACDSREIVKPRKVSGIGKLCIPCADRLYEGRAP